MGTRPENSVSQVERRHSDAALGLGGHVCVVVGNEDGNRILFLFLKKIIDTHTGAELVLVVTAAKFSLVQFAACASLARFCCFHSQGQ